MLDTVIARALQIAASCEGKTETTANEAPWLEELMAAGKNPAGWKTPESYCISAALACYGQAAAENGVQMAWVPSASCTDFWKKNKALRVTGDPRPGDIIVFQHGNSIHGHAGIVKEWTGQAVRDTEFNTSPTYGGDQRNGEGCFPKYRADHLYQKSATALWRLGYIRPALKADAPSLLSFPAPIPIPDIPPDAPTTDSGDLHQQTGEVLG